MNIISYIDKYGNKTFEEIEFNEIDNVIFSALAYLDLEKYVSKTTKNKITIKELYEIYIKDGEHTNDIKAVRGSKKVLSSIYNTKRYKDLYLYNYLYIGNDEEQFSAITIEINKKLVYVSYEGTDHLISGWKEDFMMMYRFPISSQKRAIKYLNERFFLSNKKIIVGGHSKGGNLALVASMSSNYIVKRKIVKVYNNDGPGLRIEEFNSNKYRSIENKYIHIIPNYSIFGLILNQSNYKVIKSQRRSIMSHDMLTWVVNDKNFMESNLSSISKSFKKGCQDWLNKYTKEEKEKFVNTLFNIFNELNIKSVTEIEENKKNILDLILKSRKLDKKSKRVISSLILGIINQFKNIKIEEIQGLVGIKSR